MRPVCLFLLLSLSATPLFSAQPHFGKEGGVRTARILGEGGRFIDVYGSGRNAQTEQAGAGLLLLCDFRRDNPAWEMPYKKILIGEQERVLLEDPRKAYWAAFVGGGRFDEVNPLSLVPVRPAPAPVHGVVEGDVLEWGGNAVHVLETPGLTRNGTSYYYDLENEKGKQRFVFCGDLVFGNGQILNLYDFQDDFPEAKIGGYHGFMGRCPKLIRSLEKIRSLQPDVLVPKHGPLVENPSEAIGTLIARIRAVYANYLSTSALWWYFGEERMTESARAMFGKPELVPADIPRMPTAQTFLRPDWQLALNTTRIVKSKNGEALVLDCWRPQIVERIDRLIETEEIRSINMLAASHYHSDHIPGLEILSERWGIPVWCSTVQETILENPPAFRMPFLDARPLSRIAAFDAEHGQTMRWNEFELTFFYFPGQTLYHDALLVERVESKENGDRAVLFVGDSFTPSGIDDYCLWNRNLLKPDQGYFRCLAILRLLNKRFEQAGKQRPVLVNQHIEKPFVFEDSQLDYMEAALRKRVVLLSELFPYPDPNFGIDHAWCRVEPYALETDPGTRLSAELVITNHAERSLRFQVQIKDYSVEVPVEPNREIRHPLQLPAPTESDYGLASIRVCCPEANLDGCCEVLLLPRQITK